MSERLHTGAVIGILGGGQLGRMLSVAASRLGFKCHIYDPSPNSPAGQVASFVTIASFEDDASLRDFANSVDVITYEFENIPASALDLLEKRRPVRPGRNALEVSQDRYLEKKFLADAGLRTARYAEVGDIESLDRAMVDVGLPAILKTRRFGYDGKGQIQIREREEMEEAHRQMAGQAAILEKFVDFEAEISVIGARSHDGVVSCYDPGENIHRNGILRTTRVPSRLGMDECREAVATTCKILDQLDYIGVIGVEFFVTEHGLLINEMAPRVHNSGHWTQQGCNVDQFEQHIRAVAMLPLGSAARYANVAMENLIGNDILKIPEILMENNASLHLYGKESVRAGRKMGHVNRIDEKD